MNKPKKKNTNKSDFFDVVVYAVPELLLLPFRILFIVARGVGKLIRGYFDFV